MKRMAKKITIDELAAMVKTGFEDAHKTMHENFDKVWDKFSEVTAELIQINRRLTSIEEATRGHEKELQTHKHHLNLTDARLDHLEAAT